MPKLRRLKVSEVKLDAKNANKGTKRGREFIEGSLKKYGLGRSILLDKDGSVIAGNKTLEAFKKSGGKEIIVVGSNGNQLIAVQREDLKLESKIGRSLAIADNRSQELDLEWDAEILSTLDLKMDDLFKDSELRKILGDLAPEIEAPEPQLDKAEKLRKKWKTARGQIWKIGEHRLMCGDSIADLPALMDGELARLLLTDPPYNVGIAGGTHDPRDAKNYKMGKWMNVAMENDLVSDEAFDTFLNAILSASSDQMDVGAAFYVCSPAGSTETQFRNAINKVFVLRQCIVWVKQQFVFGRQDYHWRHESILYGWKEGAAHYFSGDKTQDTVWEIDRPMRSEKEHPTVKPLGLFAKAMQNSSRSGEIVLDVCCGSGTSICVSQALERKCYGMEIEPKYVAVALERLSEMGLKPELTNRV